MPALQETREQDGRAGAGHEHDLRATEAHSGDGVHPSGVIELVLPLDLSGTGVREIVHTGGAVTGARGARLQQVPCRTCHGIGKWRRISYR